MTNKLFLITISIMLFLAPTAHGFQVTPASKAIQLGQGQQETITIRLVGTKTEKVMLYLGDYIIDRRGTVGFEAPEEGDRNSAKEWISPLTTAEEVTYYDTIEQKMVTRRAPVVNLNEGEVKEVSFRLSPPIDAKGEYYATLHFRDITPLETDNSDRPQVAVYFAIAARLSIQITGSFIPVKSGSAFDGEVYQGEGSIRLFSAFRNSGNVHLNVKGKTFIRRKSDSRVFAEIDLTPAGSQPDGSAFILPEGLRDFEGFLSRPLPAGDYIAETIYDYGSYIKPKQAVEFRVEENTESKDFQAYSFEPKEINISSQPGTTEIQKVTVYNMSAESITLRILNKEGWITVLNSEVSIPEGSLRNIGIMSTVPESIEAGGSIHPLIISQVPGGLSSEVPVVIDRD
ncbi:MAG: hypothetical protein JEY99_20745 [Spirochaetales bacterium]|nr:hypothetical protein [Spirochaetales bacterium]